MDSGAISHICSYHSNFNSMKPIQNSFVTLPNHEQIPVQFIGNVRLSADLMLEDVLFVPQFKFNLFSVSFLTRKSSLSIRFLTNSCVIQELHTLKMIGSGEKIVELYVLDTSLLDLVANKRSIVTSHT